MATLSSDEAAGRRDSTAVEGLAECEHQAVDTERGELRALLAGGQPAFVEVGEGGDEEAVPLAFAPRAPGDRDQPGELRLRRARVDAVADPTGELGHLRTERGDDERRL